VDDSISGSNGFSENVQQANEYGYDYNGNLTSDANKGYTSILYNCLNLPKRVGTTNEYISYIYDAAGTKLAKIGTSSNYTYYAGSFVYSGSSLSYILTKEGMWLPGGNYQYYLKDHLGNTRLAVNTSGQGGTVVQQTDYYPFGMDIACYNGGLDNMYRYNGKEFQEDVINSKALSWYDYGARFYDPAIGRWHILDMVADLAYSWTPYRYAFNNPLRFIDPNGMTEEERIKAINIARSLLGKIYDSLIPQNDRVANGRLDCSGLVRYSIMQNESINDPFNSNGNGVSQIIKNSRKEDLNDVREGDLVVIKSGENENGHTGFITNIVRRDGKVVRYTLLHAERSWRNKYTGKMEGGDINETVIEIGSEDGYAKSSYNHRYYQWDNPETKNKKQKKSFDSNEKDQYTAEQDNTSVDNSRLKRLLINLPQGNYIVVNGQIVAQ
jgi:RHS repeat-associated protein